MLCTPLPVLGPASRKAKFGSMTQVMNHIHHVGLGLGARMHVPCHAHTKPYTA